MNSYVQQQFGILKMTQALRYEVMAALTNDDLAFSMGGNTMTFGELCREVGQVQQRYIESFDTHRHDYTLPEVAPELATDVKKITEWYHALDETYNKRIEAMPEDALHQMIDRGPNFTVPVLIQLHLYRETLLIFAAKATIYLRAMGKPLPEQVGMWMG